MSTPWPFQSLGDSQDPTLVFLHGFLGRGADWLPVAGALSAEFHCLLPDLPGHGANTDLDPAVPFSFDLLSESLSRTLDLAGVNRPVLIGYSLGGRTSLHFACNFPGRLRALVLEAVSPGLRTPVERENRRIVDDDRAARLLETGLAAFLDEWYRSDLWVSLQAHPDLLAEATRVRTENDPFWTAKALADLSPGRMKPLWDCLPGLRIPALLFSGDLDPKYTAITSEATGLIPGSTHVRIEDAGHNIHLEQPERLVEEVRRFLRHF
jgi:2-succinyl-6-hydroxy-2,4-cyclohexadiene-1-carboxylate synthase